MKNNYLIYTVCILLVMSISTACKSKKALVKTDVVDRKLMEQVERIQKNEPVFRSANVSKMSVAVDVDGRRFNTQASCKLLTDSLIHISIQPLLGFEMFKVEINKDSILAYDKVNKKRYALAFGYFKSRFGIAIGFNDLQSILSNRFFTLGSNKPDLIHCRQMGNVDNYSVVAYFAEEMMQRIMINQQDRIEELELSTTKSDYKMQVKYSQFNQLDTQLYPQQISIEANNAKRNVKFDFKISKAVFNSELNFTRIDPSKYSKGDINQLMNK